MKKIITLLAIGAIITTPSTIVVGCVKPEQHYIPTENPTMQADLSLFLSQFTLHAINDEGDYLVKHQDNNEIFTTFTKGKEAHTLAPIINYEFNNPPSVPSFELPTSNILFKTYITTMPTKLPSADQLYRDFTLHPLIRDTTEYTYTTGQTKMKEYNLANESALITIYYLTINLANNVFWSYELNKDLLEYLINYIQNNPAFYFKKDMTPPEIIKGWLTIVYYDLKKFKISNIKAIENIAELFSYLNDKIMFEFKQLDTSKIGQTGKFNVKISDKNGNYSWKLDNLKYLIKA